MIFSYVLLVKPSGRQIGFYCKAAAELYQTIYGGEIIRIRDDI